MKTLVEYINESCNTRNGIDVPTDDMIPELERLEKFNRHFVKSIYARQGCILLPSSEFNKLGNINIKDGVIDYIKSQQYISGEEDAIKYVDKYLPICTVKDAIQMFWSNDLNAFRDKFKNVDKYNLYTHVLPYLAEVTHTTQFKDGWNAYAEYMLLNKK